MRLQQAWSRIRWKTIKVPSRRAWLATGSGAQAWRGSSPESEPESHTLVQLRALSGHGWATFRTASPLQFRPATAGGNQADFKKRHPELTELVWDLEQSADMRRRRALKRARLLFSSSWEIAALMSVCESNKKTASRGRPARTVWMSTCPTRHSALTAESVLLERRAPPT